MTLQTLPFRASFALILSLLSFLLQLARDVVATMIAEVKDDLAAIGWQQRGPPPLIDPLHC